MTKPKVTVFDYDSREFIYVGETQVMNGDPLYLKDVLEMLEEFGVLDLNYFTIDDMQNDEVEYPEEDDTPKTLLKKWGI